VGGAVPVPVPVGGDSGALNQIFGGGFGPSTEGAATGFLGTGGGFGFGGSVASIIGNAGGFGFGGFGTFTSYFVGALPTTPINGILLPADPTLPVAPNGAIYLNGSGVIPNLDAIILPEGEVIVPIDKHLANSNLDFLFFSAQALGDVQAVAGVADCSGGGTLNRIVDDANPVGISLNDTSVTDFTDCVREMVRLNGSRLFTINEVVGVPFVDSTWSVSTQLSRSNLQHTNITTGNNWLSNGETITSITVLDSGITQTAYGQSTSTRIDGEFTTTQEDDFRIRVFWDLASNTYEWEFNVDATRATSFARVGTEANTAVRIPFSGIIGQPPTQGQLVVTYLSNSVATYSMTITSFIDGTVGVEMDTNADGVNDTTQLGLTWTDVMRLLR